jgi:hypothetical protein
MLPQFFPAALVDPAGDAAPVGPVMLLDLLVLAEP